MHDQTIVSILQQYPPSRMWVLFTFLIQIEIQTNDMLLSRGSKLEKVLEEKRQLSQ